MQLLGKKKKAGRSIFCLAPKTQSLEIPDNYLAQVLDTPAGSPHGLIIIKTGFDCSARSLSFNVSLLRRVSLSITEIAL